MTPRWFGGAEVVCEQEPAWSIRGCKVGLCSVKSKFFVSFLKTEAEVICKVLNENKVHLALCLWMEAFVTYCTVCWRYRLLSYTVLISGSRPLHSKGKRQVVRQDRRGSFKVEGRSTSSDKHSLFTASVERTITANSGIRICHDGLDIVHALESVTSELTWQSKTKDRLMVAG
jgi:hypothetical protein